MRTYLEERHKEKSVEVTVRKWGTGVPLASYWDENTPEGRKCVRAMASAFAERLESREVIHEQD